MVLRNKLFHQLLRFGLIGLLAGAVHFSIVVLLVESAGLKPLIANIFAFLAAFQVSYWGHRYWTFRGTTASHRMALPRLFLVCSAAFAANESLFYLFLALFNLPYPIALFLVLAILPLLTFTLSKLWVFR